MARRVVMGRMSNGSYDVRMSRIGYDALTGDVNNSRVISFSAQRVARAKMATVGQIAAIRTWMNFGQAFPAPPPVFAVLKRGGRVYFNYYTNYNAASGVPGAWYATPYTLVVQESRIMIAGTIEPDVSLQSGDRFLYFTLEQE